MDRSFADEGILVKELGGGDFIFDLAILDYGKIMAAGCIHLNEAPDLFFAARFTENGGLDESFEDRGLATTDFGVGAEGHSVCLTAEGAVVVAGATGKYGSRVERIDGDGTDSS